MAEYSVTDVRALLARCRTAGLLIRDNGSRLELSRAAGPPPAKLVDDLRIAKADVLSYLRDSRTAHVHACACCGSFFFPEPAVSCYGCRQRLVQSSRRREIVPRTADPEREVEHG